MKLKDFKDRVDELFDLYGGDLYVYTTDYQIFKVRDIQYHDIIPLEDSSLINSGILIE